MTLTRRTFLATTLVAAGTALLAACGAASNDNHSAGGTHGGGDAEYDQTFIDGMVPHHQAAVDMAKIA